MNITTSISGLGYDTIQVEEKDMFRMSMTDGIDGTPGVQVKSHGIGGGIVRLDKSGVHSIQTTENVGAAVLNCGDGTSVYLSVEQIQAVAEIAARMGL